MATSHVLAPDQRFPVGTVLTVYSGSYASFNPGGTAVTTATVQADRTATVTGLTYDSQYTAGAVINGAWRAATFRTAPDPELTTATLADVEATLPKTGSLLDPDQGLKVYRDTFGTFDEAVALSVITGRSDDPTTQVMGASDPSQTSERGSCSAFIDNTARVPTVDSTATTFTATTVAFDSVDLSDVRAGMIVDIAGNDHVGGETAVGVVASVVGSTVTLTAAGWKVGGVAAATPSNGARARINRQNKVFGLNVAVRSTTAEGSDLDGTSLAGIEVDIETDYDHGSTGFSGPTGLHAFGVDVYRNTAYSGRGLVAFSARGQHVNGFSSSGIYTGGSHFIAHSRYEYSSGVDAGVGFYDDDSKATVSFKARRAAGTDRLIEGWVGTEANPQWRSNAAGKQEWGVGGATAPDTNLYRGQADQLKTDDALFIAGLAGKGYLAFSEQSAQPGAPGANDVVIFAEDNGSGKTRLMARFNTGAVQQIAIQP